MLHFPTAHVRLIRRGITAYAVLPAIPFSRFAPAGAGRLIVPNHPKRIFE